MLTGNRLRFPCGLRHVAPSSRSVGGSVIPRTRLRGASRR